jgi:hypothetical protein
VLDVEAATDDIEVEIAIALAAARAAAFPAASRLGEHVTEEICAH